MDPLKTISKAQKIRLEKLGATVSSTTVTATEEQLWRAPIVGEQRVLLEKRGCLTIGEGSADYVAKAVHFDGSTYFSNPSLSSIDNGLFSMVGWFKHPAATAHSKAIWAVDPLDIYLSALVVRQTQEFRASLSSAITGGGDWQTTPAPSVDAWHSFIMSADTNHAAGAKPFKIYVDRVDVTEVVSDPGPAFTVATNGFSFYFGDDSYGDGYIGDMADVRIMPGISLLTAGDIAPATLNLFATALNKPVDPATATAALGAAGAILFSGDVVTFGANQGTGGAFALSAGALTNATTSPSD